MSATLSRRTAYKRASSNYRGKKAPKQIVGTSYDLEPIGRLMHTAVEALTLAQALLAVYAQHQASQAQTIATNPVVDSSGKNAVLAIRRRLSCQAEEVSESWHAQVTDNIKRRMPRAGRGGAAILLHLLDKPGEFISARDLAAAADVQTSSLNIVKVYICYLRQALNANGLSGDLIETGRYSYCVQADAVPLIVEMLSRP